MNKLLLILLKTSFALLGFSAIVTEIATLVERNKFDLVNFFSYFTVLSNVFAVLVLLIGAYCLAAHKKSLSVSHVRGAATLYMIVTGVVFSILLSNLDSSTLTAVPWDNVILHYIMPVILVLDWLFDRSLLKTIPFQSALWWLGFPVLYLVYSLLRGAVTNWYPYPFLNPSHTSYSAVLVTVFSIFLGGIFLIYVLTRARK